MNAFGPVGIDMKLTQKFNIKEHIQDIKFVSHSMTLSLKFHYIL